MIAIAVAVTEPLMFSVRRATTDGRARQISSPPDPLNSCLAGSVAAICGLSDFYLDHRTHLSELEINPLIVLPKGQGVRAVDVRVVRTGTLRSPDGER